MELMESGHSSDLSESESEDSSLDLDSNDLDFRRFKNFHQPHHPPRHFRRHPRHFRRRK